MPVDAPIEQTSEQASPKTVRSRVYIYLDPTLAFFAMAALILGLAAFASSSDMLSEPTNRDIWQHAAALRSLIDDPVNPINPFVVSIEGSRHYHPWWVGWAFLAKVFGFTEWDVLTLAAFASMAILLAGIFSFAKAYYRSTWGPFVLLLAMTIGWMLPIEHTGFHSPATLMHGAFYPATLLIGLSFLLWALTIHALKQSGASVWIAALTAFMFATHQLGAAIGIIGAACIIMCWGEATNRSRLLVGLSIMIGIGISTLWPYHNPLLIVLSPGNSDWEGGPDFYSLIYITAALVPAVVGLLGFTKFSVCGADRSALLGVIVFSSLYLAGLTGIQIFARFLMPLVLFLHIGLTAFLLRTFTTPSLKSSQKLWIAVGAALAMLHWTVLLNASGPSSTSSEESVYLAAEQLMRDIPNTQHVAALDLAAWPIVATGQKVLSIPWPEPMINDLAQRKAKTKVLFDPTLSQNNRIEYARQFGVKTLIVDERYTQADLLQALHRHSEANTRVEPLQRFDLKR